MRTPAVLSLFLFLVTLSLPTARAQDSKPTKPTPREQVRAAVLDYVEGLYEVAPARIERSVSPRLVKFGLARRGDDTAYRGSVMSYEQLVQLAGTWNKAGNRADDGSPKKVDVQYVGSRIATVKLTAKWGVDYMQLVREGERWQILHVLWQTHPGEPGKYTVPPADSAAVKAAVEDYLLGFYEADTERIDRSVDGKLAKFGFYGQSPMPMTFDQLRSLAARLHKGQPPPKDAPRDIEVIDVLDSTAVARLTAHWGIDLMHLAKIDGKWRIRHVVWESSPSKSGR